MPDSIIYFCIAIAAVLVLVHLWAVISVFRSDKSVVPKPYGLYLSGYSRLLVWSSGVLPDHVDILKDPAPQSTANNSGILLRLSAVTRSDSHTQARLGFLTRLIALRVVYKEVCK